MRVIYRSIFFTFALFIVNSCFAASFTFESSGDWNSVENWKDMNYPGNMVANSDSIFIKASVTIPVELNVILNGFISSNLPAVITIVGSLTLNDIGDIDSQMNISGMLNVNGETFVYQDVTNSGVINASALNVQFLNAFTNTGTVNVTGLFNADANFQNNNNIVVGATGELLTVGEFINEGNVTILGDYDLLGSLENNGTIDISGTMTSESITSNITNNSTITISGTTDYNGVFVNAINGVIDINVSAIARFSDDENTVLNAGSIILKGQMIVD